MNKVDFLANIEFNLNQMFTLNCKINTFLNPIFINEKLQIFLIPSSVSQSQLFDIQKEIIDFRQNKFPKLIVIFESIWNNKKSIILQKIAVMLGEFTLLHGRKCKLNIVSADESQLFLDKYHFLGNTKSEIRIGLYFENQLVALSIWGKVRFMKYENPPYYSAELIKFASLPNISIAGGLSKLIAHFQSLYHCKTIMTYADLSWYIGNTFENLGFQAISIAEIKSENSLGSIKYNKTY